MRVRCSYRAPRRHAASWPQYPPHRLCCSPLPSPSPPSDVYGMSLTGSNVSAAIAAVVSHGAALPSIIQLPHRLHNCPSPPFL